MKKATKRQKMSHKSKNKLPKKIDTPIEIYGVSISGTRRSEVLKKMWLQRKEMLHVATVNPEYVMEARRNPVFSNMLAQCLCVADGHGIVWASKILKHKFSNSQIERISGTELVVEILERAHRHDESVFLLGAAPGVAEAAAQAMVKRYPGLRVSWYEGAKSVVVEKNEEASMTIAKINGISPDYLLVAYGSPSQDLWIEENRPYLRVRVAMGVGGALDEWAGIVKLCPAWIDAIGFKWMWRIMHEPWRLKRVLRVFHFGLLVLYHKLID